MFCTADIVAAADILPDELGDALFLRQIAVIFLRLSDLSCRSFSSFCLVFLRLRRNGRNFLVAKSYRNLVIIKGVRHEHRRRRIIAFRLNALRIEL